MFFHYVACSPFELTATSYHKFYHDVQSIWFHIWSPLFFACRPLLVIPSPPHWLSCSCDWATAADVLTVISPDFSLELTGFFPGKHLIHFLVLKMKDFRNFVLHNCVLDFDAEQVYLQLQVTNLKNNEVTVNPKPQTLEKNWFFENPIP